QGNVSPSSPSNSCSYCLCLGLFEPTSEENLVNSTLEDVSYASSNRARLVLRGLALTGLTVFLVVALMGAFDESAESVSPDGAVKIGRASCRERGEGAEGMVALR